MWQGGLLFIICIIVHTSTQTYRPLGQFPLYSAAFLNIGRYNDSSSYQLVATGFGVITGDALYYVPNLASDLGNISQVLPTVVSFDVVWPNEADQVPQNAIVGTPFALWSAGGFLVPGSTTGAVAIFPGDGYTYTSYPSQISQDKSGWFYHRIEWFDVNGDGLKDVVCARATKPLFGSGEGELVWMEQPTNGLGTLPWNTYHIVDGPDIFFEFADLNGDSIPEIIAAQYFSQELVLYYTTTSWSDPTSVQTIIIDPKIGSAFDLKLIDINNDGRIDLLATNNENNPSTSAVFAYEIPTNLHGNWVRHTLATGFKVRSSNANAGTPGTLTPIYPVASNKTRPWILLAGDDSQLAYQMRPVGNNWDYETTVIMDFQATVGLIAAEDLDGDGYTEFFVPAYDTGYVYAYTYSP